MLHEAIKADAVVSCLALETKLTHQIADLYDYLCVTSDSKACEDACSKEQAPGPHVCMIRRSVWLLTQYLTPHSCECSVTFDTMDSTLLVQQTRPHMDSKESGHSIHKQADAQHAGPTNFRR